MVGADGEVGDVGPRVGLAGARVDLGPRVEVDVGDGLAVLPRAGDELDVVDAAVVRPEPLVFAVRRDREEGRVAARGLEKGRHEERRALGEVAEARVLQRAALPSALRSWLGVDVTPRPAPQG